MKRIFSMAVIALMVTVAAPSASAWDLNDLLGGGNSESSSSGNGLGDVIAGVGNALGISVGKTEIKDLAGVWDYTDPAVTFKSDNLLLKAGGAAAASQVENKLAPYYKTAGLNSLKLTINEDSTFTFKLRVTSLNGTISHNKETGNFVFTFKALNTINIGSMETYIIKNGNQMSVTFDVSKLMVIIQKVAKVSGNSTIKGVSSLLDQYEGITAGFKLKRE